MDGFKAYQYYMAIKLHFSSEKFNVFENKGKVKCSRERYNSRNDYFIFEKLSKKYKNDHDLIQFLASNFIYRNPNVIYSGSEAEDNFTEWQRRKQSVTKLFLDDCHTLVSVHKSINQLFYCTNNTIPYIIDLYLSKKINIESVRILDDQMHFIQDWKDNSILTLLVDDIKLIKKSKGFVKYDINKVTPIFNNLQEDLGQI